MRHFFCETVKKGKVLHDYQEDSRTLWRKNRSGNMELSAATLQAAQEITFYWKAIKSKYYHYGPFPGLFFSFHYYCIAVSAIVFVNTIGRTLQLVGDSVKWDLPCEYWYFGELCPDSLRRACHSEWHFILCIVISFKAEIKSVIAFVVCERHKLHLEMCL